MSSTDRLRGGLDTARVPATDRAREVLVRQVYRAKATRYISRQLGDAAGEVIAALGLDQDERQPRRCAHCDQALIGGKPGKRYCDSACANAGRAGRKAADQ